MDRETIDLLEQESPLDLMRFAKLFLRFFYRKDIGEIKKGLNSIGNGKNISRQIKTFQKKKLIELCKFAYKNSEYYRDIFRKINLDLDNLSNFNKIPVLDKRTIRKFKDKLIVKNLKPWQSYETCTGGSTGEPLWIFLSPKAGVIDDVHQEYFARYSGYKEGDIFVSFITPTIPHKLIRKNIFWINKPSDFPFGRRKYSALYLNDKNIHLYLADFLNLKPSLVRSYPSAIYEIARYVNKEHIKIPFKIKAITLTSEQAFDWQIREIKKAFHTKIYFQYGHAEISIFAYTSADSRQYFCSPFYGFTEVLDDQGRQVSEGSAGEVVVTGFYNYAMPFIRYRTGDIAIYGGVKNGVVYLDKLQGRTQDYIYGVNGKKTALTTLVFGQYYAAFRNIKKWQIVQSKKGYADLKVVPDKYFGLKDKLEIRKRFRKFADTKVRFEYVKNISLTKRGKFLFLIQKIKT